MSQSDQKRGRDHETTGNAAPSQTDDRSVRQRIEPASAAAVSSGRSFASSSLPSRLSLLGLAVVERQLILQSLDWESLVHVASTCRQLRVESLHKESGKFLSKVAPSEFGVMVCWDTVNEDRACHASPLYRAHAGVSLDFPCPYGRSYDELSRKAALFQRIVSLDGHDQIDPPKPDGMWTEALQLLARLQQVRRVTISSVWLQSPALQHALFDLPALTQLTFPDRSDPFRLVDAAVLRASKLTDVVIGAIAPDQHFGALRLAPALRQMRLGPPNDGSLKRIRFPPTLEQLTLESFDDETCGSRATLKALFTGTPRLHTLQLDWCCVEPFLQGVMDAGVVALPQLRSVVLRLTDGANPEVYASLLRRLLHRFPLVTVTLRVDDHHQYISAWVGYGRWSRVEIKYEFAVDPPPSPHASDDDEGNEVPEESDDEGDAVDA